VTTDELRTALERAGAERRSAREQLREADNTLAHLLARAIRSDDLTMTEAVQLAGVGRTLGYKLVRERTPQPETSGA
jgi:hypothetical protein